MVQISILSFFSIFVTFFLHICCIWIHSLYYYALCARCNHFWSRRFYFLLFMLSHRNLLYMGLSLKTLQNLQLVQDAATLEVKLNLTLKFACVTQVQKWHWLPLRFQAQLNMLFIIRNMGNSDMSLTRY